MTCSHMCDPAPCTLPRWLSPPYKTPGWFCFWLHQRKSLPSCSLPCPSKLQAAFNLLPGQAAPNRPKKVPDAFLRVFSRVAGMAELAQCARDDGCCSYLGRCWAGGLSARSLGATLQLALSRLRAAPLYLAACRRGGLGIKSYSPTHQQPPGQAARRACEQEHVLSPPRVTPSQGW